MKKGAASGHPGMFWDGEKWVSSQDGATYNNGTFFANGGPVFPPSGAGPMFADGGIHIKKSHEGRFTEYKKRTGKTTEEALHSKDPHVRQMANFARNAAKWHHETGGPTYQQGGGTNRVDNTHEWWSVNPIQTHMNPELAEKRTADSSYAAGQLQTNPGYVTAANKMYMDFMHQNPNSPDTENIRYKMDAYNAALDTYNKTHRKQYGGSFHPLSKFMQDGGNPFGPESDDPNNYDPGIPAQQSTYHPPTDTGVVPQQNGPSALWRQGINDQQAQQNINYGAGSSQAYDPSTGNTGTDDTNTDPQSGNQGGGSGKSGWNKFYNGAAVGYGLLGSGMAIASAYNNLADERRMAGYRRSLGTSDNIAKINQPGSKGDWDQYGNFRPNQNTPVRPGMYYPMGSNAPVTQYGGTFAMGGSYSQDGGMYHAGQEVELSDTEIDRLKKMGYKIDMM